VQPKKRAGRPKGSKNKTGLLPSKLSAQARAAIARTKKARAEIDKFLEGFVDDDPTPVMVTVGPPRRRKGEQSEESEALSVAPAEREKRARKTSKARQKRADNAKARRAQKQALDKAIDQFMADGASIVREVTESLKPVMQPPASLHGVRIG